MPDPLLPLLATIERLDAAATPGPWTVLTDSDVTDPDYGHVIEWPTGIGAPSSKVIRYAEFGDNDNNDAAAVAFSRNTLAPLASMLRVAVEALETYADERTWRGHINEHGEYVTPVDADHGARARAALAAIRRMAAEI